MNKGLTELLQIQKELHIEERLTVVCRYLLFVGLTAESYSFFTSRGCYS